MTQIIGKLKLFARQLKALGFCNLCCFHTFANVSKAQGKKTKQIVHTEINTRETNIAPMHVSKYLFNLKHDSNFICKANQEITQNICPLESFPSPSPVVVTNLLVSERCP